ncbi:MAG: VapC toxin family PIN domain ribonuclease [Ignavibacteriales bacterium CG12_big_fil_rev_8_21_14_0_65_30_8]|nr:MAG: VapC toxin family PIN domain ribonuclease [Ignavibacteriales bacterium CG12_big_fil_rev_8_21_14_0_65_30_8]
MIFLDSTVLTDYFNGKTNWHVEVLNSILGSELVVIVDYVLTEVIQVFSSDKDFQKAKTILLSFSCFDIGGKELAIKSANNFRLLKKKGVTVRKTIDVIIATFCIAKKLTLLHNNKDFEPFEKYLNLKVYKN